jgi:hypothetical protein
LNADAFLRAETFWLERAAALVDAVVEALPGRDPLEVLADPSAPDVLRRCVPAHYDGSHMGVTVHKIALYLLREASAGKDPAR